MFKSVRWSKVPSQIILQLLCFPLQLFKTLDALLAANDRYTDIDRRQHRQLWHPKHQLPLPDLALFLSKKFVLMNHFALHHKEGIQQNLRTIMWVFHYWTNLSRPSNNIEWIVSTPCAGRKRIQYMPAVLAHNRYFDHIWHEKPCVWCLIISWWPVTTHKLLFWIYIEDMSGYSGVQPSLFE